MRKEPMISNTNAEAAGEPPQGHRDEKRRPTKVKQRHDCPNMKGKHDESGAPNNRLG
jgi:hypothetical protein